MRQRREIIESRKSIVTAALVACCCLPVAARAQEPTRTFVIKEPTGWFGVRISDTAMMTDEGTAFFDAYPVVTHVDPNSPASKAGVQIGDVLLMFNGHDMRGGSIELAQWLKVGAPFVLKIRRNDRTRMLRGTLTKRPSDWEQRMVVEMTQQMSVKDRLDMRSGSLSREPMTGMLSVRSRVPTDPLPAVLAPALGFGAGGTYPFAGASFTQLNSDLCDVLGVKGDGVFVTNVVEGSAARNAGLRGGDIILRADNMKVSSPIDLVQAIRSADEKDRSVDLQIMRKHQLQSLTLRW
ncbi:MAG: PDZ domain-containing protein [Gemmatimonadaceae bacterium]